MAIASRLVKVQPAFEIREMVHHRGARSFSISRSAGLATRRASMSGTMTVQPSFTSRERWLPLTEVIMRIAGFVFVIALAGFPSTTSAMPAAPVPMPTKPTLVQLQCSPQRCIDLRTGVYTESTCDRYGCRQSSGPVGRVGGGRGALYEGDDDFDYEPRPRRRHYGGGAGPGGIDCNRSRCIDGSGRVWESTCDRGGCRPLRPARSQRW